MPAQTLVDRLNEQIGHEYAAHQQYVACAVYYDGLTMPRMAAFFYAQALEERDHAMMIVQYLIDTEAAVVLPGMDAPVSAFDDVVAPVALALEQERQVTAQIHALVALAREEGDDASEQFLDWFVEEQVEEEATMSSLLTVVRRAQHDVDAIEDYVAREQSGEGADPATSPVHPSAPRVAGR